MTAINTTLKVDDLKPGKALRLVISGHPIALIKAKNGELYALDDKCSHGEISLSEGFVDNETIECWAHGAKFSLATGEALTLPAFEPVGRYEVIVDNDEIYIDYDAE